MRLQPLLLSILVALLCIPACATQSTPTANPPQQTTDATADGDGVSGMYSFLREGEFVQVTLEDGKVTGFVSRYGDSAGDQGAFLDQFFSKGALEGNKLSFTTKPVHDLWYEFAGTVERVPTKKTTEEGFRLLRGKLTQFTTDAKKNVSSKTRDVEFKSFPQDLDDPRSDH